MPKLFTIGGYIIYFWSNENNEPIHIHIAEKTPSGNATKIWLTEAGGCVVANNNSKIPMSKLHTMMSVIAAQRDLIIEQWKAHFKTEDVRYYC